MPKVVSTPGHSVAGHKLYPLHHLLVAVSMFLVSATKLSPVCCPSVAGYKGVAYKSTVT